MKQDYQILELASTSGVICQYQMASNLETEGKVWDPGRMGHWLESTHKVRIYNYRKNIIVLQKKMLKLLLLLLCSEWVCVTKYILITCLHFCGFDDHNYTIIMLETTSQWKVFKFNLNGLIWSSPRNLTNRIKTILREKYS